MIQWGDGKTIEDPVFRCHLSDNSVSRQFGVSWRQFGVSWCRQFGVSSSLLLPLHQLHFPRKPIGEQSPADEISPRGWTPRSLSEYLLVLSHGRWISLGFGLFGLGPTLCAHYPPQSTPTLQERRQIFKRLWVKHISCHSADTFSRPRNRNLRIPRADLIMPNTGSTMCLCAA